MSIRFYCGCGKHLRARDELAGQREGWRGSGVHTADVSRPPLPPTKDAPAARVRLDRPSSVRAVQQLRVDGHRGKVGAGAVGEGKAVKVCFGLSDGGSGLRGLAAGSGVLTTDGCAGGVNRAQAGRRMRSKRSKIILFCFLDADG